MAAHLPGSTSVTPAEPHVIGEFAEGAYGPTIRLTARSPHGVASLIRLIDGLASGMPSRTIALEEQPDFCIDASLRHLGLKLVARPGARRLVRDRRGGFVWNGTRDEWNTIAMLMEPLTRQAGHQYLTSEISDDALIELSQGELCP
jgi:hypothetical protein